jgi:hypothetical protein
VTRPDPDAVRLKATIEAIDGYRRAYRLLHEEVTQSSRRVGSQLIPVMVVVLSFGIEKALKGVLMFRDGKPARGHNLYQLFDELAEDTKDSLLAATGYPHLRWRQEKTSVSSLLTPIARRLSRRLLAYLTKLSTTRQRSTPGVITKRTQPRSLNFTMLTQWLPSSTPASLS